MKRIVLYLFWSLDVTKGSKIRDEDFFFFFKVTYGNETKLKIIDLEGSLS